MESITVVTLKQLISDNKDPILLDVRESWEFDLCSIDDSINIPMSEITGRIQELKSNKDIVVICHHGSRSLQVAYYLKESGLENKIINLDGGINAWAEQIEPEMPRY
jgi:rhodanese-related sulfurtransferase